MSYLATKNKSSAPQSAIIPAAELDRMSREYQAALCKTAELIKLNDERDKLFMAMKESFDILFGEVGLLKRELSEKMVLIERLNKEIRRLRQLKVIKKRLNQGKVVNLAVDTDE